MLELELRKKRVLGLRILRTCLKMINSRAKVKVEIRV